jgi:GNAT superfamily N-acetyltransferase
MTRLDLDPAVRAILADDWGDRRAWFEFTLRNRACHAIVADADGEVVGTGVATVNGPVAWIGTIWVAPTQRRRGLGVALTEAVAAIATNAGAQTLVLVATDRGRRLYERLGFEVQTWYRTFQAPAHGHDAPPAEDAEALGLRAFERGDLDTIVALDRTATGEDRRQVLEELATRDTTRVLGDDEAGIRGFVTRAPWGGGATVAPRLADGLAIVAARRRATASGRPVRCGILLENEAGAAAHERAGWTEAWRAPRLIRGTPLAWHPEHLWGQFNHAMG